jgi:methylglutaconyl-CoA hydratase
MSQFNTISLEINGKTAKVNLNRPEVHNAFNAELIDDLTYAFEQLKTNNEVRAIILTGNGNSFCAGADLNWMKGIVNYSYQENFEDSLKLAKLMHLICTHPKPVIGRINGSAIGGGVGLVSVCDIAFSIDNAEFGFSEVRLGLVPAVISPFIIAKIGTTKAREYFITGDRFTAAQAKDFGLINYFATAEELDKIIETKISSILKSGPEAISRAKDLVFRYNFGDFTEYQQYTARVIAELRKSNEGQEGMNAFLEKRKPNWSL